MSKYKQRDAMEITAELVEWVAMNGGDSIHGIVEWSNDPKEYPLKQSFSILKVKLTLYPQSDRWGGQHFIAESQTGRLFLLRSSRARNP
jgi:hypothetical protein